TANGFRRRPHRALITAADDGHDRTEPAAVNAVHTSNGSQRATTTEPASMTGLGAIAELAAQLRVDLVRSATSAG
ncbi:MAG: hypothetical protein QOG28_5385, partial [Trebonia sp.]|nr:hypothetical protein [Trebonia sp.]